jgi:hypothetical protein
MARSHTQRSTNPLYLFQTRSIRLATQPIHAERFKAIHGTLAHTTFDEPAVFVPDALDSPRYTAYSRGTLQGHPWHARAHDVVSCERPLRIGCFHSAYIVQCDKLVVFFEVSAVGGRR